MIKLPVEPCPLLGPTAELLKHLLEQRGPGLKVRANTVASAPRLVTFSPAQSHRLGEADHQAERVGPGASRVGAAAGSESLKSLRTVADFSTGCATVGASQATRSRCRIEKRSCCLSGGGSSWHGNRGCETLSVLKSQNIGLVTSS